jgi:hypothetical protein
MWGILLSEIYAKATGSDVLLPPKLSTAACQACP